MFTIIAIRFVVFVIFVCDQFLRLSRLFASIVMRFCDCRDCCDYCDAVYAIIFNTFAIIAVVACLLHVDGG